MSYDLQVWSVSKPDWNEIASNVDGWEISTHGMEFESRKWHIVVGPCSLVEEEDIPEEVLGTLPGIHYLTEINLEGSYAQKSAHTHLSRISRLIAKTSRGIVLDPQLSTISTPRGVRRLSEAKSKGRISILEFGWWFNDSPLIEEGGLARMLKLIETYLPEAIPRRYGPYEPPQYRYETEGKDHFLSFVASERIYVVWYPTYPVLNVGLGILDGYGPRKNGYKSNTVHISVDASVWVQPGWDVALRRIWRQMSEFIHPFYGEVRLLRNYILERGRVGADWDTDSHPIRNGWWNGVPSPMGSAVVIGESYAELWPEFVSRSEHSEGLLMYISTKNWAIGERVDSIVGGVPRHIAQGQYKRRFTYPEAWPFEGPFAED
jgi:hypothetical protein